jgi:hypothetical protein
MKPSNRKDDHRPRAVQSARPVAVKYRRLAAIALLAALPSGIVAVRAGASVADGSFESGDFTSWTVFNQPRGSGSWFVYSGTAAPLSGLRIPAPPEGTFAAVSDQTGPGSHVLYQDIPLEANFAHTLSFVLFYENTAGTFVTPDTLNFHVFPNQQYRVDVLRPTAAPNSVAPRDVLLRAFRTDVGESSRLGPTTITVDLTPFAGTTVRLRFAEVDNVGFFQAGVDSVRIESQARTPRTKHDCRNGGWRRFVDDQGRPFKNQGQCVRFVVHNNR